MRQSTSFLLSVLFLAAFNVQAASSHAHRPPPVPASSHAVSFAPGDNETDRSRDGLQGPVRRVRTETSKLISKSGKMAEGARVVLETATYDMKGAKIDTAYFLGAGGSLTGKEVYTYDDHGNIVEMTLFNTDGSVLSKEKYEYEFDAMGNWTRMTTAVAVIENGQMSFEPTEVTYRIIAYYLEDSTAKKLQSAAPAANTNAAATVTPAGMASENKLAAPVAAKHEPSATQPKPPAAPANSNAAVSTSKAAVNASASVSTSKSAADTAPAVKRAPAVPASSGAQAASALSLDMPNMTASHNGGAPVVKTNDDVPPPPVSKASLRPISGGVLNGKAVSMPKPVYPEMARRAQMTGIVTVEVVVDASGKVIGARAVSGPEMLRDAAERAARLAKFTPTLLSGQPMRVVGLITYNFSL